MTLSRYQLQLIERDPAFRPVLIPCRHRGKLIDRTDCGCKVYTCTQHGTCSTDKRSGLRLCQNCEHYEGQE